jgi:hypothetical protein
MPTAFMLIALTLLVAACAGPHSSLPSGARSPTCIDGWTTPAPGTARRSNAIDMIRTSLVPRKGDTYVVDEMRYFTGPEDTEISAPRRDVERWYVKAHLQTDPSVADRWILRRTDVGDGVA